jgi:hypothetical protein
MTCSEKRTSNRIITKITPNRPSVIFQTVAAGGLLKGRRQAQRKDDLIDYF